MFTPSIRKGADLRKTVFQFALKPWPLAGPSSNMAVGALYRSPRPIA